MRLLASLAVSMMLAVLPGASQTASPPTLQLTLEDCLEYAYGNSYSRQSTVLNEALREEVYNQSKMERLPSLSASVSENLNHNNGNSATWDGSYGLNTSITVFQGGSINQTIRQNELLLEQTMYRTEQYDNELTIQILQAFLTVLGNEELLKYQAAVLEASAEQAEQGKARYNAGSILESDYLLLEAQYATDRNNVIETEITRENSLSSLKALLSLDPVQNIDVVYPDTTSIREMLVLPSQAYVLERAMTTLPDLQISNYNVEIAETGVKISKSAFMPTISIGGSIGSGHNNNFQNYSNQISDRFNQQAGVSVSIPIFNRNRTRSNVNQSKIELYKAELDNKQTQLDVQQTVLQEYRNVVAAVSKYRSSDIRQDAYLRSFEAYRAKFDAGAITTVELLQQQNNYISAMNDYIQSKYGFLLKRKILDVYMGEKITM